MAKLRPRARIVRTIGDQLISGPEAALIELVKNAYDADSPSVHIAISPPGSLQGGRTSGQIVVTDTGHGMTAEDLVDKWFEPATTDKVKRRLSPGHRRMLGAKGVGRFATARLGRLLRLSCASKQQGKMLEVSEICVDWQDFETSHYLDEVEIAIQTRAGTCSERPGVRLEISDLRDPWIKTQLEFLVRELRRLISPKEARDHEFKLFLDLSAFTVEEHGFDGPALIAGIFSQADEHSDIADDCVTDPTEIRPFSLSNVYHYRVEGAFDVEGAFAGKFINQRAEGQTLLIHLPASQMAEGEQACGEVQIRINIYDREGDAVVDLFRKLGLNAIGRMDARKILDEHIGVGIYRDGFRIRPYGDAETDWLELESRRVQDPSRKIGLNQVWGIVDIEDESVSGLLERSSREGLDHNGAFSRLRQVMAGLMAHVEMLRVNFREMAGLSRKQEGNTRGLRTQADLPATARAVESLPDRYRKKVQRALQQESAALKKAIDDLEAYQHKLATQSSLGLVVSQVLHDGRRFLGDINTRSKELADGAPRLQEDSAFGTHFREAFAKNANSIHGSARHLTKLFRSLDPLASRKRGKPKSLDIVDVIEQCLGFFSDSMAEGGIKVDKEFPDSLPQAIGYETDVMAALLNIIDNAVYWLSISSAKPRLLRVSVSFSNKWIRIALVNTGSVIDELFRNNLFTPGFTLKPEGSGLGLTIAREAMRASKGKVVYDTEAEETTFVIEIPGI